MEKSYKTKLTISKALSIKQPFAELILRGKKKIELRNWNTKFRGYFWIHASRSFGNREKEIAKEHGLKFDELPKGAIVGYAKLIEVKEYKNKKEFLKDKNLHLAKDASKFPLYGFILKDAKRIRPIKYKGRLGFFRMLINL